MRSDPNCKLCWAPHTDRRAGLQRPGRRVELLRSHGAQDLDIGAELYDFWLDSLLETVEETDPEYSPTVKKAWEDVMMVGIHYLCVRYNA